MQKRGLLYKVFQKQQTTGIYCHFEHYQKKPAECQGHERIKTRLSPRDAFNFCTGLLLSHMLINVKLPRTIFAYKISFPLCWLHIHVHVCIDLLTNSNICSLNTCLVLKEGQCISRELLWFTVDIIKETTCALNS